MKNHGPTSCTISLPQKKCSFRRGFFWQKFSPPTNSPYQLAIWKCTTPYPKQSGPLLPILINGGTWGPARRDGRKSEWVSLWLFHPYTTWVKWAPTFQSLFLFFFQAHPRRTWDPPSTTSPTATTKTTSRFWTNNHWTESRVIPFVKFARFGEVTFLKRTKNTEKWKPPAEWTNHPWGTQRFEKTSPQDELWRLLHLWEYRFVKP